MPSPGSEGEGRWLARSEEGCEGNSRGGNGEKPAGLVKSALLSAPWAGGKRTGLNCPRWVSNGVFGRGPGQGLERTWTLGGKVGLASERFKENAALSVHGGRSLLPESGSRHHPHWHSRPAAQLSPQNKPNRPKSLLAVGGSQRRPGASGEA